MFRLLCIWSVISTSTSFNSYKITQSWLIYSAKLRLMSNWNRTNLLNRLTFPAAFFFFLVLICEYFARFTCRHIFLSHRLIPLSSRYLLPSGHLLPTSPVLGFSVLGTFCFHNRSQLIGYAWDDLTTFFSSFFFFW